MTTTNEEIVAEFEDKAGNTLKDDCWLSIAGDFEVEKAADWLTKVLEAKDTEWAAYSEQNGKDAYHSGYTDGVATCDERVAAARGEGREEVRDKLRKLLDVYSTHEVQNLD